MLRKKSSASSISIASSQNSLSWTILITCFRYFTQMPHYPQIKPLQILLAGHIPFFETLNYFAYGQQAITAPSTSFCVTEFMLPLAHFWTCQLVVSQLVTNALMKTHTITTKNANQQAFGTTIIEDFVSGLLSEG